MILPRQQSFKTLTQTVRLRNFPDLMSSKTGWIPLIPVYSAKTPCNTLSCAGTLDLEGSIHD